MSLNRDCTVRGFVHGRSLPKITLNIVSKASKMATRATLLYRVSTKSTFRGSLFHQMVKYFFDTRYNKVALGRL